MSELHNPIKGLPMTYQYKSFENFIVLDQNRSVEYALSAGKSIAKNKNYRSRIVMISGGMNSGKTHLAIAIAKAAGNALGYKLSCLYMAAIEFFINVSESRGKIDYIEQLVNNNSVIIIDNYNPVSTIKNEYLYLLTEKAKHRYRCIIITTQQSKEELHKEHDLLIKQLTDVINVQYQTGIDAVVRDMTKYEIQKREQEIAQEKSVPKFIIYNTFGKDFAIDINNMHPDTPKGDELSPIWIEKTGLYQGSLVESELPKDSWVRFFNEFQPKGQSISQIIAETTRKIGWVPEAE